MDQPVCSIPNASYTPHTIWLTLFTPVRHDHLHFIKTLLQTICSLGICCAFKGLYPAYIAGVLDKYCLKTALASVICMWPRARPPS